jgi:serine/threonine-protein kinase
VSSSGDRSARADLADRAHFERRVNERRLALEKALFLGWVVWFVFYALDVYAVLVLHARGSLLWFAGMRALGMAFIVGSYLGCRTRGIPSSRVTSLELLGFCGCAATISVMAVENGGLASHYIQGVSFVIMYHATAVPERWSRSLAVGLATAATFPIILGSAALIDPLVAAQWRDPPTLAMFAHDYVFVISTALLASGGSHFVWSAREQVFEARRLGRYRLKSRIASGGFGQVWLASDDRKGADVALKILDARSDSHAGAQARFTREAKAASTLHDEHTVRVHDWGASDDGICFIAMELLEGRTIGAAVQAEGPFAAERIVAIARQTCGSLAEAHRTGIIHRDIKPENLFLLNGRDRDFVKLLDFGMAKVTDPDADATVTQAGWLGGTPAYMSPEMCRGGAADARSDLYALGAVLYFMACGRPPFTADGLAALFAAHQFEPPSPPSQHASVPADLERVILRCLAKSPADRFASAEDLDAALATCEARAPHT